MIKSKLPTAVDPAEVPLAIDQPSLFFSRLPLELRREIYAYAFFSSSSDTVSSKLAIPLLTCRQWYIEARSIAFATIDWRICMRDACYDIYDDEIYQRWGILHEVDGPPSVPVPPTLCTMFENASLSKQHIESLRRLTIVKCMYHHYKVINDRSAHPLIWRMFPCALAKYQLDSVTLERDLMPEWRSGRAIDWHWKPDLAQIWDTKVTNSIKRLR
jgi:hypothetical protein